MHACLCADACAREQEQAQEATTIYACLYIQVECKASSKASSRLVVKLQLVVKLAVSSRAMLAYTSRWHVTHQQHETNAGLVSWSQRFNAGLVSWSQRFNAGLLSWSQRGLVPRLRGLVMHSGMSLINHTRLTVLTQLLGSEA